MGQFMHPEDPDQGFLLPPSMKDWLPKGHLVWFISDTIDQLDIDPLLAQYRPSGKGQLAYHPAVLLKLLVYGYCTGVFSSRKIARHIEENIAFRILAGGLDPSHRTICRFREENLEHFERLFVQVVRIAREAGLVKMGTLAIDGTKLKANASKHKAMSYERMKAEERRLEGEIKALLKAARNQDRIEDEKFGPDFRGDELPEELIRREDRLEKIRAAKERLEKRKHDEAVASGAAERYEKGPNHFQHPPGTPRPKDQENFTDPDSRIMKASSGSFEQSYNAQLAVDAGSQIIVATDLTQCAADAEQLVPLIDAAQKNTTTKPQSALADAGYRSEGNLRTLRKRGIEAYIAIGREGKNQSAVSSGLVETRRMERRLRTKKGRLRYKRRKAIVEPVIGWMKRVLGFRSLSLRGVKKVRAEWALACLALNLRRMATVVTYS